MVDENHDGLLSLEEFGMLIRRFQGRFRDAKNNADEKDVTHKGHAIGHSDLETPMTDTEVQFLFDLIDTDQSGSISVKEFGDFLKEKSREHSGRWQNALDIARQQDMLEHERKRREYVRRKELAGQQRLAERQAREAAEAENGVGAPAGGEGDRRGNEASSGRNSDAASTAPSSVDFYGSKAYVRKRKAQLGLPVSSDHPRPKTDKKKRGGGHEERLKKAATPTIGALLDFEEYGDRPAASTSSFSSSSARGTDASPTLQERVWAQRLQDVPHLFRKAPGEDRAIARRRKAQEDKTTAAKRDGLRQYDAKTDWRPQYTPPHVGAPDVHGWGSFEQEREAGRIRRAQAEHAMHMRLAKRPMYHGDASAHVIEGEGHAIAARTRKSALSGKERLQQQRHRRLLAEARRLKLKQEEEEAGSSSLAAQLGRVGSTTTTTTTKKKKKKKKPTTQKTPASVSVSASIATPYTPADSEALRQAGWITHDSVASNPSGSPVTADGSLSELETLAMVGLGASAGSASSSAAGAADASSSSSPVSRAAHTPLATPSANSGKRRAQAQKRAGSAAASAPRAGAGSSPSPPPAPQAAEPSMSAPPKQSKAARRRAPKGAPSSVRRGSFFGLTTHAQTQRRRDLNEGKLKGEVDEFGLRKRRTGGRIHGSAPEENRMGALYLASGARKTFNQQSSASGKHRHHHGKQRRRTHHHRGGRHHQKRGHGNGNRNRVLNKRVSKTRSSPEPQLSSSTKSRVTKRPAFGTAVARKDHFEAAAASATPGLGPASSGTASGKGKQSRPRIGSPVGDRASTGIRKGWSPSIIRGTSMTAHTHTSSAVVMPSPRGAELGGAGFASNSPSSQGGDDMAAELIRSANDE